jgi:hypothetical protein
MAFFPSWVSVPLPHSSPAYSSVSADEPFERQYQLPHHVANANATVNASASASANANANANGIISPHNCGPVRHAAVAASSSQLAAPPAKSRRVDYY